MILLHKRLYSERANCFQILLCRIFSFFACIYSGALQNCLVALQVRRKHQILSGTGVLDGYKLPCVCCEPNLDSLEEQQVLLTLNHLSSPRFLFISRDNILSVWRSWFCCIVTKSKDLQRLPRVQISFFYSSHPVRTLLRDEGKTLLTPPPRITRDDRTTAVVLRYCLEWMYVGPSCLM